jgi:MerR family transcriptional regulator, light-induced transcriptional regulator
VNAVHDAYLAALRGGDRHAAYRALDEALDDGRELAQVYLEVVQPSMREIGRLWQEDELTVAEEHVATAITEAAMSRMFERVFVWRDVRTPRLLAACAEDERHQVGLRMLCDLLELAGWETTYLGASVPIESLVDLIVKHQPDAVAISATIAPHVPRVREAIRSIRAATLPRQPLIAVGGRVFLSDPSLAERLGADLTAGDADEAVRLLDARLRRDPRAA